MALWLLVQAVFRQASQFMERHPQAETDHMQSSRVKVKRREEEVKRVFMSCSATPGNEACDDFGRAS